MKYWINILFLKTILKTIYLEFVEVGDEFVHGNTCNLDSLVEELFVFVLGQMGLPLFCEVEDALVELVEHWVTHSCLVQLKEAWDAVLIVIVFLEWSSQHFLADHLQHTVIVHVAHWIVILLDQVAQVLDRFGFSQINMLAIWHQEVSQIDGLENAVLVWLKLGDLLIVKLVQVHHVEVLSGWEVHSIVEAHGCIVSGFNWFVEIKLWDHAEVVGQTLQVVTGQELLVLIQEELSTTILVQTELFTSQVSWVVHVEIVVVRVQANIFSEVRQFSVIVVSHVIVSKVLLNGVNMIVIDLHGIVHAIESFLLGLADHVWVEEMVWVGLINSWQDNSGELGFVEDNHVDGLSEHDVLEVIASPNHWAEEKI